MLEDVHYVGDACKGGHFRMAGKGAVPEAQARCTGCNHLWWVGAGEVQKDSMPECPKCHSIGVSTGKSRLKQTK